MENKDENLRYLQKTSINIIYFLKVKVVKNLQEMRCGFNKVCTHVCIFVSIMITH